MPFVVQFTPPRINAAVAVTLASHAAATAGANALLAASLPLVPVDTGELLASGHVESTSTGAAVVYDAIAKDGYDYAVRQHEDLQLHHPNGGQAKFLEQPMHSEHVAIGEAVAAILRAAIA